ncbi:MAG TPA: universal stress protein [Kiritimatiellia bacterium]|nr:universal stress protein [Kiritimatiellia bacterium]
MKTILVPVDFSNVTENVLAAAAAAGKGFGAKLVLLFVAAPEPEFIGYDPGPSSVREAVARQYAEEHRRLQELGAGLEAEGLEVTSLSVQGYAAEKILSEAEKHGAGLIVMGSHGHGMLRQLLVGSVAEGVIREARCPVMVVPAHAKRSGG